jgi:cobalt-precorrin-6B (C15)-methyltransferase
MRRPPGIPDEEFIREEGVPMTKSEVRAVVLSKLGVGEGARLLDVGCGTGSVSVEAALLGAEVVAMDKDPKAVELTRRNAAKFGVEKRVSVLLGEAPREMPQGSFDAVFIGGGGRGVGAILKAALERVRPGGRVVVDVATLETLAALVPVLEGLKFDVVLMQVARSRRVGSYTIMTPLNPVYIFTVYL